MFIYERAVAFHEVDAAGLVFFPHFLTYAHEAMDRLFAPLDGGYLALVTARRVGLPAVHVECDFVSPLAYGDVVRIETSVRRVGNRSLELRYRFVRARDGERAAELLHTVVTTDLERLESCPMPEDVRRVALAHLEPPP